MKAPPRPRCWVLLVASVTGTDKRCRELAEPGNPDGLCWVHARAYRDSTRRLKRAPAEKPKEKP
jgi:hypothetical protein